MHPFVLIIQKLSHVSDVIRAGKREINGWKDELINIKNIKLRTNT